MVVYECVLVENNSENEKENRTWSLERNYFQKLSSINPSVLLRMSVEVGAVVIAVVLYIMFANFRFKKVEKEAEVEAANVSVEIVREIPGVKIKPLSDVELQYPKKDLWRGPLVTRGNWMVGKREYFRYSTEEEDERGITPIRLEGWVEERTYHHLLCNYGVCKSLSLI